MNHVHACHLSRPDYNETRINENEKQKNSAAIQMAPSANILGFKTSVHFTRV